MKIVTSTFSGNAGIGIYVHRALGVAVSDVSLESNAVSDNGQGIVAAGVDGISIVGNHVTGHQGHAKSGIALGDDTTHATVSRNELAANFRGM